MSGDASSRLNPFATRWTRPGVLPYLFAAGDDATRVVERLRAHHWRGAIVGPHGSGKTTLVATLLPALAAAGRYPRVVTLSQGQHRWPADALAGPELTPSTQLIVDGYEQLGLLARLGLQARCWWRGVGLLITSHRRTLLRTLFITQPSEAIALLLVQRLTAQRGPAPSEEVVRSAYRAAHGDMREMLFALYDWYESAGGAPPNR